MKRIEQSVLLAGLLAMVLAGCSGMRGGEPAGPMAGTGTMGMTGTDSGTATRIDDGDGMAGTGTSGSSGSTGAAGTTGASAAMGAAGTGAPIASTGTPNSTVTSIEIIPRQAGAAAGATTMTGERAYRITLRMDDGRSQVVTQEWAPAFTTGERVRLENGAIER